MINITNTNESCILIPTDYTDVKQIVLREEVKIPASSFFEIQTGIQIECSGMSAVVVTEDIEVEVNITAQSEMFTEENTTEPKELILNVYNYGKIDLILPAGSIISNLHEVVMTVSPVLNEENVVIYNNNNLQIYSENSTLTSITKTSTRVNNHSPDVYTNLFF